MHGAQIEFSLFIAAAMVVVLVTLYFRYRKLQLFHQERMAALEKGLPVPKAYTPAPWSPRVYLLRGLMWSFAGLAFCISIWGVALTTQRPQSAETVLWRANNLAQSTGISKEEAKQIIDKDRTSNQEGLPKGVALLGLIPMGVGLAYLIFYYTGDRGRSNSQLSTLES